MRKSVSIDQSHQLISTLSTNVDWAKLDPDVVQRIIKDPTNAGNQFTQFLNNGARVVVGKPTIIPINRTTPFNPAEFIGKGWKIVEKDERSLALAELNLDEIRCEDMLKSGETSITGEVRLERLKKSSLIRLDAKIFQEFWENQQLIPEIWKEKINGNVRYTDFPGTILCRPRGGRYVLSLYWSGGEWGRLYCWLGRDWLASVLSAVLASN